MTYNGVAPRAGELRFPAPRLSFACEMDPDFSDERAGVVRRLNAAGVPVTGIPLLPLADGYYFTADNTGQAARSYQEFTAWTRRHELVWDSVGLDIEPDARIYLQIMNGPWDCCRCWRPGCWTGRGRPGPGPPTRSSWNRSTPTAGRQRTTSSR